MNAGCLGFSNFSLENAARRRFGKFIGAKWNTTTTTTRQDAILSWSNIEFDTMGFLSKLQPTRISIPKPFAFKYVRVTANVYHQNGSQTFTLRHIYQYRNGVVIDQAAVCREGTGTSTADNGASMSGVFIVQPGDYFEHRIDEDDTSVTNITASFSIEVLG